MWFFIPIPRVRRRRVIYRTTFRSGRPSGSAVSLRRNVVIWCCLPAALLPVFGIAALATPDYPSASHVVRWLFVIGCALSWAAVISVMFWIGGHPNWGTMPFAWYMRKQLQANTPAAPKMLGPEPPRSQAYYSDRR